MDVVISSGGKGGAFSLNVPALGMELQRGLMKGDTVLLSRTGEGTRVGLIFPKLGDDLFASTRLTLSFIHTSQRRGPWVPHKGSPVRCPGGRRVRRRPTWTWARCLPARGGTAPQRRCLAEAAERGAGGAQISSLKRKFHRCTPT